MAKYKVTKVFIVISTSKSEALKRVNTAPDETLEYLSIVEQAAEQNGFFKSVRSQVIGR